MIGDTLIPVTNNICEYIAVIRCLETIINNNILSSSILIKVDSKLVASQVSGIWKTNN